MSPSPVEILATVLFALAVLHTFLTKYFERLAHLQPTHAGAWHLFGEVEAVFGIWSVLLIAWMVAVADLHAAIDYLESLDFKEPMFVFVIMVVAASKPILQLCQFAVRSTAVAVPLPASMARYLVILCLVPLLGSFITEPAAMTLAALLLRDQFYARGISERCKYFTLGVLFVNVSIGGTLTPYAAPPVLMVASKWDWDVTYMLSHFGWRAALAVAINALLVTLAFANELRRLDAEPGRARDVPLAVILVHLGFLAGVVSFAHHPVVFMGLFLFFLGFTSAYDKYQNRLILREGLMVALFLAGLIVLGTPQKWWLQGVLAGMSNDTLYFGATLLTAITDNAALTYLGSLVEGTDEAYRQALVAGAVSGGGLTLIANAPNPAGAAMLKGHFRDEAIGPLQLLIAALLPTLVAIIAFRLI